MHSSYSIEDLFKVDLKAEACSAVTLAVRINSSLVVAVINTVMPGTFINHTMEQVVKKQLPIC